MCFVFLTQSFIWWIIPSLRQYFKAHDALIMYGIIVYKKHQHYLYEYVLVFLTQSFIWSSTWVEVVYKSTNQTKRSIRCSVFSISTESSILSKDTPAPYRIKKICLRARVKFKVSLRTAAPTPLSKTSAMVVYNGTNKFKQRPNSAWPAIKLGFHSDRTRLPQRPNSA